MTDAVISDDDDYDDDGDDDHDDDENDDETTKTVLLAVSMHFQFLSESNQPVYPFKSFWTRRNHTAM